MASYEPIIRMDENAFRVPEKMQSNMGRKPLTDMTNSKKPVAKNRSSVKNLSGYKPPVKVAQPPKAARKPLGDLTNSNKPRAQNKSAKNNCTENLSAVRKEHVHSFAAEEGFLHDHSKCIKANQQSLNMSMDYFLETFAIPPDSTPVKAPRLPQVSELEIDTLMEIKEMEFESFNIYAPRSPPQAPRSPGSPCWSSDFSYLEFSPLKLKESPVRG